MSMFKKCPVIMLPTNEKSKLVISFKEKSFNQLVDPKLTLIEESNYQLSNIQSQHLYILSDEPIKEGDWIFANQGVHKVTDIKDGKYPYGTLNYKGDKIYHHDSWKKIIATTNSSLGVEPNELYPEWNRLRLPQPYQSFIEKYVEEYNKGNVITEVMVDYEEIKTWCNDGKVCVCNNPNFCNENRNGLKHILKVNPKDNTITIKKVKDNWSREEVVKLIEKHTEDMFKQQITLNKWIEENL